MLQDKKIFFIDCDGTLVLGDKILPGSKEFLAALREKNRIIYLLTNNSSQTPEKYWQKLRHLGLNLTIDNMLVSTSAALEYLKQNQLINIYCLANEPVLNYIKDCGFIITDNQPQAALLTYDNSLNYEKLRQFISFLRKGVPYYATHHDIVCPDPDGNLPDIGTFIKVIEMTTGLLPQKIFGKPNKEFVSPILAKHNLSFKDAVIIGDRLYTDIKLAEDSDMTCVLVLTGESSRAEAAQSRLKIDIIADQLEELIKLL